MHRTLKANCIRVRPQWMYEDRHIIGDIPLHALMIPGTHNSGAYDTEFGVSGILKKVLIIFFNIAYLEIGQFEYYEKVFHKSRRRCLEPTFIWYPLF